MQQDLDPDSPDGVGQVNNDSLPRGDFEYGPLRNQSFKYFKNWKVLTVANFVQFHSDQNTD